MGMMTEQAPTLRTLASFKGRRFFNNVLGVKVYSEEGDYIGFIKRVILKKEDESVKRVFIKKVDGKILSIDPHFLIVNNNRLILASFSSANRNLVNSELSLLVREFKKLSDELEHIRYNILILDERYFRGQISKEEYEVERNKLEKERARVLTIIRQKIKYLESSKSYIFELHDSPLLLKLKEFLEKIEIEVYGEMSLENFISVLTLVD